MVGEDEVKTAAMDIKGAAQVFQGHGGTFDVPARSARPPGAVPGRLARFGAFPEGKIHGDKEAAGELLAATGAARQSFERAMDDDFNTALAIAVLFDLSRDINSFVAKVKEGLSSQGLQALVEARNTLVTLGQEVLGLFEQTRAAEEDGGVVNQLMELIITIRQRARANKDWAIADEIRNQLGEMNIVLEDTPQGVRWKRK